MAVLGSELNIYTGWDFVDEINPSSIFSFGWYDYESLSTTSGTPYDQYFSNWNNPTDVFGVLNSGWFDSNSESTNNGIPYDVYFAGWNDYTNNLKVFESGWFSDTSNTTTSGMPYDVYFSNWNNVSDTFGIFNSGWFDEITSATNVLISLNKLDFNFVLRSINRAGSGFTEVELNPLQINFVLRRLKNVIARGEFLSFINKADIRNVVINIDNKKESILFEPENEDSIDFFNTGVW